jgi:hypothetical protein
MFHGRGPFGDWKVERRYDVLVFPINGCVSHVDSPNIHIVLSDGIVDDMLSPV